MENLIPTILVGVILIIIGIINMKGNISTLHSYHRHRVSEEDRPKFAKLVGFGTLIVGASIIVFSILSMLFDRNGMSHLMIIATAELIVGIIVGLAISFYAMIKYNKGIF